MGWSAYGQTMTIPLLDPSMVALQPTAAAAELAAQMSTNARHRLSLDDDAAARLTRLVVHARPPTC